MVKGQSDSNEKKWPQDNRRVRETHAKTTGQLDGNRRLWDGPNPIGGIGELGNERGQIGGLPIDGMGS